MAMLDESIMFQCSSRAEMDDWYKDLKTYLGGMGIVSPPSSTTHSNSVDIYEGKLSLWSLLELYRSVHSYVTSLGG